MKLAFILTMPNVGSWNGHWSGEGQLYTKVRELGRSKEAIQKAKELDDRNFYYHWSDGWGANVEVKIVKGSESAKLKRKSKGFLGYDWMIDSILKYDKILSHKEQEELNNDN